MKKNIEIVEFETGKVVESIDVSNKSFKTIERIERGININLNHNSYYTRVKTELIDKLKKEIGL